MRYQSTVYKPPVRTYRGRYYTSDESGSLSPPRRNRHERHSDMDSLAEAITSALTSTRTFSVLRKPPRLPRLGPLFPSAYRRITPERQSEVETPEAILSWTGFGCSQRLLPVEIGQRIQRRHENSRQIFGRNWTTGIE